MHNKKQDLTGEKSNPRSTRTKKMLHATSTTIMSTRQEEPIFTKEIQHRPGRRPCYDDDTRITYTTTGILQLWVGRDQAGATWMSHTAPHHTTTTRLDIPTYRHVRRLPNNEEEPFSEVSSDGESTTTQGRGLRAWSYDRFPCLEEQ